MENDDMNFDLPVVLQETLIDAIKKFRDMSESDVYDVMILMMETHILGVYKDAREEYEILPLDTLIDAVSFWKHAIIDDYQDEPMEWINDENIARWAEAVGKLTFLEALFKRVKDEERSIIYVQLKENV